MSTNEELIKEIESLLNSYDGVAPTSINSDLLRFMSRDDLLGIVDSLLDQKESHLSPDLEWLEKFKQVKQ
ncbi:MAG: hypothetical protein WCR69_01605 [Sulfuricurvum sp.]